MRCKASGPRKATACDECVTPSDSDSQSAVTCASATPQACAFFRTNPNVTLVAHLLPATPPGFPLPSLCVPLSPSLSYQTGCPVAVSNTDSKSSGQSECAHPTLRTPHPTPHTLPTSRSASFQRHWASVTCELPCKRVWVAQWLSPTIDTPFFVCFSHSR